MRDKRIVLAVALATAALLSPMFLTRPSSATLDGEILQSPMLMKTHPKNGEMNVSLFEPIIANFSEPVELVRLSIEINPMVPGLVLTWSIDMTVLTLQHAAPFLQCTWYTVTIRYDGVVMWGEVPNPWTFKTVCTSPYIVSTNPPDGATGVALDALIVVTFNEPMDPTTLAVSISPFTVIDAVIWSAGDIVVTIHHANFLVCVGYTVLVSHAHDKEGNDLGPGPVPNPWSFSTAACNMNVGGLEVHRVPNDNVLLTWRAFPNATHYAVYHSNDRTALWPWALAADVTTNSALMDGDLSDGLDHFYLVRAYTSMGQTGNSTMGALWHMQVTKNPGKANTFWFSLPYNTIYRKASNIATELTDAKVDVIGKWDPIKQDQILYYSMKGKWRGQDFLISPGDGLFLGIVSDFSWPVNGTDKTVVLNIPFAQRHRTHYVWLGLPYTGTTDTASELVIAIEGGLGPDSHTKIDKVGKWDFATQGSVVFEWTMSGWWGQDFIIRPGDGIWAQVTSAFSWMPGLLTPEVP